MTIGALTGVPFLDLVAQHQEIAADLEPDLRTVLDTAGFVGGPFVSAFEQEYAAFVGVPHCVALGNGTDAVELALRAVGVGPGDEVIIPANTFVATAEAVCRAGATPVVVDVDPDALLMTAQAAAAARTSATKAVVPVHLYGQLAPVEQIADALPGVAVVEDAAQSQGAERLGRVSGSLGLAAATSFYPGKNLGAAGDAGALTCTDDEVATRTRLLGNHGSQRKYVHETLGFNSRMDAIQAAVLRHKLRRLAEWNSRRREAAARYDDLLQGVDQVRPVATLPGNTHVFHLYVVQVPDRDRVLDALLAAGIGAALHYPEPVHQTSAFGTLTASCPVAEQAAGRILSLPMFPHLRADQQERVVDVLTSVL